MSEVAEDRITNLPSSILHHILSFVDTREAAQTIVLSKRWRYIWRSIPILKFQNYNSGKPDTFIDFVDKTLEFHDETNIKEFSLSSVAYLNEPRIQKWISTVISHNVEDFSLRLNQRDVISMPSSFYTCESLTTLKLLSSTDFCFPRYISFPRLRRFIISGAKFSDEFWNEQLFSSSHVLQYLGVVFCTWSDMKNFCISNPALKNIDIINPQNGGFGFQNFSLKIDAPNLETLTYVGRVAKDYVLSSFPALVKATVDFSFREYGSMWEKDIAYGALACKFLQALAHVMYLKISHRTLQVLSVADDLLNNLPSYHNLHKLILTQKVTADTVVIVLLEKAPNLVSLDFEEFDPPDPDEDDNDEDIGDHGGEDNHYNDDAEGDDNNDDEDDGWALDVVDARCSFIHLKFVSFNKFTGKAWEMRWLKLILKNAKALETMTISRDFISYRKSENLMADITSLPRASASCVFKFSHKQR